MLTGYEFARIGLEELTPENIKVFEENIGLYCQKCLSVKSTKWYLERLVNNYLPDYRIICEKCKNK